MRTIIEEKIMRTVIIEIPDEVDDMIVHPETAEMWIAARADELGLVWHTRTSAPSHQYVYGRVGRNGRFFTNRDDALDAFHTDYSKSTRISAPAGKTPTSLGVVVVVTDANGNPEAWVTRLS